MMARPRRQAQVEPDNEATAAVEEEPEVVDAEGVEVVEERAPATDGDIEHEREKDAENEAMEAERIVAEASASMEIERREASPPANVLPSPNEWEATMAIARTIAATKFVPEAYRGEPESVVAGILAGREIGLGPMAALRQIHMIDGRPSFSAELMLSQMRKGGLVILESESTRERAYIKARRQDTGEIASVEWTYAEAEQVVTRGKRLVEKDNWRNFPADMLWARCVGRLARRLGSDLLGGMVYAAEEMQDWDDGGYGGGGGYAAQPSSTAPAPKVALTAEAPRGTLQDIIGVMNSIDSTMPWAIWVEQAVKAQYDVDGGIRGIPADPPTLRQEAVIRLANTVGRLLELTGGREFPPPTRAECIEAFAFGFDAALLAGPPVPLSPDEVDLYPPAKGADVEQAAAEEAAADAFTGPPEEG